MLFLKNDGIQYRARIRRRGTAVSRTYKETSFTLYFLYYRRDCVYVRLGVSGNVSWKKETYLAAEGPSPRTVPSDAISRLTARIKWKTFLEARRECLCAHLRAYICITHTCTRMWWMCITCTSPVYIYSHYEASHQSVFFYFSSYKTLSTSLLCTSVSLFACYLII